MKKRFATAILIAACVALCAAVWPRSDAGEKAPDDAENAMMNAAVPIIPEANYSLSRALSADTMLTLTPEFTVSETVEITAEKEETILVESVMQTEAGIAPATPVQTPRSAPTSADPYHTDVYPNNIYSEELVYDANGNLIGKTVTYPTAFGSDTIWIDGHAYYDIPGFGLVEWSGPSQRTEDYTMYESGVKIGIMGGEDEALASGATANQSAETPAPVGEVIDQTINTIPEKSSTPPDDKP